MILLFPASLLKSIFTRIHVTQPTQACNPHDMLLTDTTFTDGMESWDQAKLEKVVNDKHGNEVANKTKTEIVRALDFCLSLC